MIKTYVKILFGVGIVGLISLGLVLTKNPNFYAAALGWAALIGSPFLVIQYFHSIFKVEEELEQGSAVEAETE